MAGRKSKYTPETVDKVIEGLRLGLTDQDASAYAGISWDTFDNYRKRHSDFSERVREAKVQRTALWLNKLRKAGDNDWRAISDLLDRCAPNYRKNVGVTHDGTVKHEHGMSPEFRAIAERIAMERGLPVDEVIAEAEAILQGAA